MPIKFIACTRYYTAVYALRRANVTNGVHRGPPVRGLCKAKADKGAAGMAGATALHLACRKGRDECVEVLVDAGADLEAVDARGSTPLHAAASGGNEDIVEYLLLKDADPSAKDGKGKTVGYGAPHALVYLPLDST